MGKASRSRAFLLAFAAVGSLGGCLSARPQCELATPCAADAACVAGACRSPEALPGRDAERVAFAPVAAASPDRVADSSAVVRLTDGGKLLLRFAVPDWGTRRLVAAYLVVCRVRVAASMPAGAAAGPVLYAERIGDEWEPETVTYANQPRTFTTSAPPVRLEDAADCARLDVREVLLRWPRRDRSDQGIAVLQRGPAPLDVALARVATSGAAQAPFVPGPRLELYLAPR